jgi:hypothetical protein
MKSELEMLVEYDMYILGYDPSNPEDVNRYWEFMLT